MLCLSANLALIILRTVYCYEYSKLTNTNFIFMKNILKLLKLAEQFQDAVNSSSKGGFNNDIKNSPKKDLIIQKSNNSFDEIFEDIHSKYDMILYHFYLRLPEKFKKYFNDLSINDKIEEMYYFLDHGKFKYSNI